MNFILFNPDEWRGESVGCNGHPLAPTPHLDELAAQGVRFEQCHVQHPVCTPSRCSFMTGWYPHVRGHRTLWHCLRPDEPNLLRSLKQNGYEVRWFGKNDLLSPGSFASSVTSAESRGGGMFGPNPYAPGDPAFHSFLYEPYAGPVERHGDYANVQAAVDFLQSGPTRPFCLYLPLSFPHCPYSAPPPWHDLVDPAALPPLRPVGADKPDFHDLIRRTRRLDELPDEHFRRLQAVYLGMIGFTDMLLGRLLAALEETGLDRDTAVLVFSDHGDWAGDYGLVEKWPSALDDCLTRVPFVIRAPGGAAGHVVREPVELFDMMATVLELAEVRAQHTHFARSLVPQLQGAAGDPTRAVFAEGGYARHEPHCFEGRSDDNAALWANPEHIYYPKGKLQQDHPESVCRATMVRTQRHKLVYRTDGMCELYDLEQDPRELRNRHGDPAYAEVQSALERRLLAWLTETSDVTPWEPDPRGLPPREGGSV